MQSYIREHGTLNGFDDGTIIFAKPLWCYRKQTGVSIYTIDGVDYLLMFISYTAVSDFLSKDIYIFNIERFSKMLENMMLTFKI